MFGLAKSITATVINTTDLKCGVYGNRINLFFQFVADISCRFHAKKAKQLEFMPVGTEQALLQSLHCKTQ